MSIRRTALLLILPAAAALAAFRYVPEMAASVRLAVAPTGNTARYLVREQLVGRDLPNDAVGETTAVTGALVFTDAGALVPAQSKIEVNVTGLKSDSDRRDGYIRNRLLESEAHPTVTFSPTMVHGLSGALPTSGSASLHLMGNMTVKGVTRPSTWEVRANFSGNTVTGKATTRFTFEEFGLTQPRVPVLLSVADTIRLEYDFTLQRSNIP